MGRQGALPREISKTYIAVGELWKMFRPRNVVCDQGFRREKSVVFPIQSLIHVQLNSVVGDWFELVSPLLALH